jgi:hypothetical protein
MALRVVNPETVLQAIGFNELQALTNKTKTRKSPAMSCKQRDARPEVE